MPNKYYVDSAGCPSKIDLGLRLAPDGSVHSADALRYAADGMVTARAAQQDGDGKAPPLPPQAAATDRARQLFHAMSRLLGDAIGDHDNAALQALRKEHGEQLFQVMYHTGRQLTYSREQTALVKKQAKQLQIAWRMADELRSMVYRVVNDHQSVIMLELWQAPNKPRKGSKRAKQLEAKADELRKHLEEAERLYRQAYTAISEG